MSKHDQVSSTNDASIDADKMEIQTRADIGPIKQGRRQLFKSATTVGGVALSTALLPQSWTRPVINSVLLPAHAQTTTPEGDSNPGVERVLNCEVRDDQGALLAEGGNVEFSTPLTITFTLSPAPGVVLAGAQRLICNDIEGPEIAIQADVNGVYVASLKAGSICDNQGAEAIFVDFGGATAKCSWAAFAV